MLKIQSCIQPGSDTTVGIPRVPKQLISCGSVKINRGNPIKVYDLDAKLILAQD